MPANETPPTCPHCGHGDRAPLPTNPVARAYAWYLKTIWRVPPSCPAMLTHLEAGHEWAEGCGCPDVYHLVGT